MTAVRSAVHTPVGPWSVRPGWGIAVDLTPPQILKTRRVRTVRKLVAGGLGLIVVACVAGYFPAAHERAAAQDALAGVQQQTTQLHSDLAKYDSTTRIQSTVSGVRQQISTVMTGDVSTDELLARIHAALPADMTIQQASVTVSLAGVAGATPDAAGTPGLDDTSHPRIGDVTIGGTSRELADLSTFVERLQRLTGIVDVIPTTNAADKTGVQYGVTFGITDQLKTHAYDLTQAGTK
jgi:hypothetical protein